jgi:uncharacterized protein with GYD domain
MARMSRQGGQNDAALHDPLLLHSGSQGRARPGTGGPERRFGQLVEDMGGRLNAFYNSLGEYDGVAIFEAPDEQTAHSIELAASQPGHLKETKILTLLPVKESVDAMREASKQEYLAPKGWLDRVHSELWGG